MGIAELVFLRGAESLLHLKLDRAEICIGSNPTNDVVVPDPSVPDVAAVLIDRGALRFLLRDLTGGTLSLGGRPLEGDEVDLEDGDIIGIGPYALKLQIRADEAPPRARGGRTAVLGLEERPVEETAVTYQGKRYAVRSDHPFNIGSDEDSDLIVEDASVSQFHCRIKLEEGRWFIVDLQSRNGTEVNGLKVRAAELPIPATVRIGQAVLRFEASTPRPRAAAPAGSFRGMIAESAGMRRVFDLVSRLADAREAVLISGESGSGKELVARALHDESSRASKPYLALNCGALTSTLIESELFGIVRGSFTGAVDKPGAFEATDGGTLFLDEIGELPLEFQPKLLRALESSRIRRVGGTREIPVDTRIVAATHRNLEELVANGEFREDLFHRLFVLSIPIPPLRDRPEDIIGLARHFLASQAPARALSFTADAEKALLDWGWPGNVRELRNIIVRAILMTDGDIIRARDLQFTKDAFLKSSKDARKSVRQFEQEERERMLAAIETAEGNQAEAARILGMSKSTFHDRVKRYGIVAKPR